MIANKTTMKSVTKNENHLYMVRYKCEKCLSFIKNEMSIKRRKR